MTDDNGEQPPGLHDNIDVGKGRNNFSLKDFKKQLLTAVEDGKEEFNLRLMLSLLFRYQEVQDFFQEKKIDAINLSGVLHTNRIRDSYSRQRERERAQKSYLAGNEEDPQDTEQDNRYRRKEDIRRLVDDIRSSLALWHEDESNPVAVLKAILANGYPITSHCSLQEFKSLNITPVVLFPELAAKPEEIARRKDPEERDIAARVRRELRNMDDTTDTKQEGLGNRSGRGNRGDDEEGPMRV